jgi:hypothetical protein
MIQMKKFFSSFLVVTLLSAITISSCKKGENDPFLSLKSRASRLTGEWKLTSGTVKETTTSSSSSTTTTTTFTETTKTEVTTSGSSTDTDVYNYTQDIVFEKTGHYSSLVVETQISSDGSDIPSNFQVTTTDDETGNWAFLGKNKETELKRKEAVAINPHTSTSTSVSSFGTTTSTSTIDGWVFAGVMEIDRLKTKELVFKGTYTSTNSSSTTTTEYEYIYTAK